MGKKALILGGYGKAGSYIAELLLANTSRIEIIIAGRNLIKAEAETKKLNNKFHKNRVSALKVDAGNFEELREAFKFCDLVIVSFPYRDGQERIVIESALEAGINYIDLNADTEKYQVLQEYSKKIEEEKLIFLTGAGIIPGCPAMLAHLVGSYYDSIKKMKISSLYRDKNIPYGGVYDIISHAGKTALIYKNNAWQKASPFAMKKIKFSNKFKTRIAVPVYLSELEEIPNKLNLEELSTYQAGINPFADGIYFIWKTLNLSHLESTLNLGVRLFSWANKYFTRPPFGLALKIEALGEKNGSLENSSILLEQTDMYLATAIPVVAAVLQIFDGEIKKVGSSFMGYVVASRGYLERLKELGMEVTIDNF
ncbi:saccharopine dehydrogenase NADP-binding domain-containing protein [Orenia marismortui]|uniref:saccharopine dehydrogenase NADP-binding domain-containing protein n=1 Tax=Orenia marismortui TaxID=46469 RepID=UPI00037BC045|nr:saccharopine dehydrogenase NADP-binding domain-containing protein [Orenia marismortui]